MINIETVTVDTSGVDAAIAAAEKAYNKASAAAGVSYAISSLGAWTVYVTTCTAAGVSYDTALKAAGDGFTNSIIIAKEEYEKDYCRITGLYQDAINIINGGGTLPDGYFDGTGSMDVEVCFVAGTPILLADGSSKPIEEMAVGDEVFARPHDNPTGDLLKCKVVRVFHNAPQSTFELTFENGLTLRATKEHPFYVADQGWVQTLNLEPGTTCISANGTPIKLLAKKFIEAKVPVYNIEVEQAHTYHVGPSKQSALLVHNLCSLCDGSRPTTAWSPVCMDNCKIVVQTHTAEPIQEIVSAVGNTAAVVAPFIPGVGEAMDAATLADPSSTMLEKTVAGFSLALSIGSVGIIPNFGSWFKAGTRMAHVAGHTVDATRIADKVSTATKAIDNPVHSVTNVVRVASEASANDSAQIVRYIQKGEKVEDIINEAKALTLQNKIEHAVVKLNTGERAIVKGGESSISMENVKTIYGHIHPYHLLARGPSPEDYQALQELNQGFSYVFEHGRTFLIDLMDHTKHLPAGESTILH